MATCAGNARLFTPVNFLAASLIVLICCADKLAILRGLMSKIMSIAYIDLKRYFGEIGGGYFLRVTLSPSYSGLAQSVGAELGFDLSQLISRSYTTLGGIVRHFHQLGNHRCETGVE